MHLFGIHRVLLTSSVVCVFGLGWQAGHEEQAGESGHCQQDSHLARTLRPHDIGRAACNKHPDALIITHTCMDMWRSSRGLARNPCHIPRAHVRTNTHEAENWAQIVTLGISTRRRRARSLCLQLGGKWKLRSKLSTSALIRDDIGSNWRAQLLRLTMRHMESSSKLCMYLPSCWRVAKVIFRPLCLCLKSAWKVSSAIERPRGTQPHLQVWCVDWKCSLFNCTRCDLHFPARM